jgi:cardiolipin synthase
MTLDPRRSNITISVPNILTLLRILLTPLFVIMLLKEMHLWALLVFAAAGVSDGLDGFVARYFNQRTVLGAYLDPVADKLLLISAFVGLAIQKIIPGWVAVIVITRDLIICLGIAIITLTEKQYEVNPRIISKITTVVQIATILLTLLGFQVAGVLVLRDVFFWITAIVTTLSGLHYIFIGMQILQDGSTKDSNE